MDWNKTIIFEEFRPIFLLFFIRHNHGINKPWRQFENWHCDLACKQPCEAEKNFQTGCQLFHPNMVEFSLYGEISGEILGVFSWGKWRPELSQNSPKDLLNFQAVFLQNPLKVYLSITGRLSFDFGDLFLQLYSRWLAVSSFTIIKERCWYLEFTGTILGKLELWFNKFIHLLW